MEGQDNSKEELLATIADLSRDALRHVERPPADTLPSKWFGDGA